MSKTTEDMDRVAIGLGADCGMWREESSGQGQGVFCAFPYPLAAGRS